jgi:hypothetical protein
MKVQQKGALGALLLWGALGSAWAETFRCHQADGTILFQEAPCPLAQMEPSAAAQPAAEPKPPAPAPVVIVPAMPSSPPPPSVAKPVGPERPTKAQARAKPSKEDDEEIRPTKRKRDVIELTAQLERCRADAPGFAEKSAAVYAAWTRRHAETLAEFDKVLAAKVRAGRRGENTLPLHMCTDEWLASIEPLSRMPDPRFVSVEKTWQVFMGALMTGDRVAAMSCLSGRAEARWKARVEQLSDDELREIASSIRALKVQWGDDYEKEGLVADTENRAVGIAFRNVNEEWKITDWGGAAPAMPVTEKRSSPGS